MTATHDGCISGLTIVSKSLLRMTTEQWKSPASQFQRLTGRVLELLLDAASVGSSHSHTKRVVLLFDCFLRVIDELPIASAINFTTERFQTLQILFYGALGSKKFIDVSPATRVTWAYHFYQVMKHLNSKTPVNLADHHQKAAQAVPEDFVQAFEQLKLDDEQCQNLQPYLLISSSGIEYNVLLREMVPILGERFTNQFHDGLRSIARRKAKDTALRDFGTTFARFVCHQKELNKPVSPRLLADRYYVQTFLLEFMEYHFKKYIRRTTVAQEGTLSSLQKLWSRYEKYWASLVKEEIVAAPLSAFPAGNPSLLSGTSVGHLKVKIDTSGESTLVTQKLITTVPLKFTDEEATQLLFRQMKADFSKVQGWLRDHIDEFFHDHHLGTIMEEEIEILPPKEEIELATRSTSNEPGFALAIKYFKEVHGGYTDTSRHPTVVYPDLAARSRISKERLARYLGIPSRREALALIGLLASYDGRFSESALATAKLLSTSGRRTNAVETDGGLTLSVLKQRDAKDGWQHVTLKHEAAELVRKWIEVTTPLRNYMKRNGVAGWQNLILYTGNPLGAPAHFTRSSNINSAFRHFALTYEAVLGQLASYVTIPRIKSTRGVLVFLETLDITKMASELGNTNETSLRHYLPDAIWNYFSTRWLRIFQNLLIVEATKDTPYMQRALHFSTADEMDEFLRNHAVSPLIPNLDKVSEKPDRDPEVQAASELMVVASPGLFAVLLSISEAVARAETLEREITPQALYWTEFTNRLKAHVESAAFHDRNIKRMMAAAANSSNPDNFMKVVCA
ncbi:hypothetical protein [Massilia sp. UBA6681]|uniref:hypothetical protein n=1 Tax=Massilia sp. UBA6681 TaxID=1946839 RepID=UPI0025BD8A85|nr:hypothetical protein [Massilia sp. UBA6681]